MTAPVVLDSLTCTRCGATVHVAQAPAGHIDPATFVGGCCLAPPPRSQIGRGRRHRRAPEYDPATAEIPY